MASIGVGTELPVGIELHVSASDKEKYKRSIRKLEAHGVTVKVVEDVGSHKKWAFTNPSTFNAKLVVLIDDDAIYPRDFVETLRTESEGNPAKVLAYEFQEVVSSDGRKFEIPLGVGGVGYPATLLENIQSLGPRYRTVSFFNDDFYLFFSAMKLKADPAVRVTSRAPRRDVYIAQYTKPLMAQNVWGSRNNENLAQCLNFFHL